MKDGRNNAKRLFDEEREEEYHGFVSSRSLKGRDFSSEEEESEKFPAFPGKNRPFCPTIDASIFSLFFHSHREREVASFLSSPAT